MSDNKIIEGSFSVNGTETPTTHEPIDQIDSSQWHNLPSSKLYDHRNALMNRIAIVHSMPNGAIMATQIQRGIARIDGILASRTDERIDLI